VDLVYTTAPSHSTNLVGLLLRRLHGIRWCAEFRDPWCNPHSPPPTPLVGRLNQPLERMCIRAADHIVTVTEQTAELYRQRLGSQGGKVLMVRNGIPALNPRQRHRDDKLFRIAYGGTIFGGRDTGTFLQAVQAVARDYAAAGMALRVDLFLKEPGGRQASVEAYIRGFGLAGIAHVHQSVPYEEMQRILAESDLLLLLAQGQPLQVPNKLYEYLGTGVPILAVVDADGETASLLRAVGGHHVVERDTADAIAQALRSALVSSGDAKNASSRHLLEDWLTERQMRRLLAAVRP
jgi:glycosyltransferase involved in cell wall biosynthesis